MNGSDKYMAKEYDLSEAKRGPVVSPKSGTGELLTQLDEDLLH